MSEQGDRIEFQHKGIGLTLKHQRLVVPLNQREYSWQEKHVTDLLQDLRDASVGAKSYFLGTIVLTKGANGVLEVADGQQRLATTSILLAAVRDFLLSIGKDVPAGSIEKDFLLQHDRRTEEIVPQLRLNVDDHEFFRRFVLLRPGSPERTVAPQKDSHTRMQKAAELARKHIDEIASFAGASRVERLMDLVDFIEERAQVVILTVPDYLNAFVMFETLNDRGLKASQADLLKNHILSLAGERMNEAQQKWAQMLGILETTGQEDIAVTYLRHLVVTMHGPTKERELFIKVKEHFGTKNTALSFADALAESAQDYASLFNPEHRKWNDYGTATRKHVQTLLDLGVEQIRPLLFAVARRFSVEEGRKAFALFVSWSVRFLIVGGRGGLLDRNYSIRAHEVGTGTIKTARELAKAMEKVVPTDAEFEAGFAVATVSKSHLARYYLRTLERQKKGIQPAVIANDNEQEVNLEHILPENPGTNWPGISPETAAAYYRRIGNMVLMPAVKNSLIGNSSFTDKLPHLQTTKDLELTAEVVNYGSQWDEKTIAARQKILASIAVKAWPIGVR
ncbi:Protein of unknown function [bacterium JGI 053]|nr:Protein of unknown function [bacterium JGI 053]